MSPKFLKGKKSDDLAPIATFILLLIIPLHIFFLFFFDMPECHIAGLKTKN